MANQAEVVRIFGSIRDASSVTIEDSVRDRLFEVIRQALDAGIVASQIVGFYAGKPTIADGTVELLARVEAAGVGEATRALPPPISPGVQAPSGGTPSPTVTSSVDSELVTPAEAAQILGDPDLASAPQSVITWLFRLADDPDFGGIGLFADYNPEVGEITLVGPNGESSVFSVLNGGANIVPKEIASAGTAADIARNNLLNMQAAQLAALMSGDLIPLEDGRSIIRGTTTIVDTRVAGQFAPIEGIPGTFYDPVSGTFIDQNGQQLSRDRFEFERDFIFPEEQRQFDESQALDRENISAQNRRSVLSSLVQLQGQSDARGIAGAQAAADPGNFIAAENIRRGLAPPEQGETPLFPDVNFDGTGLADIMALLLGSGQQASTQASGGIAGAVTPDAGNQDAALLSALNAERTKAGLPPLTELPPGFAGGGVPGLAEGESISNAPPAIPFDAKEFARLQEVARLANLSNVIQPSGGIAAAAPILSNTGGLTDEQLLDQTLAEISAGSTGISSAARINQDPAPIPANQFLQPGVEDFFPKEPAPMFDQSGRRLPALAQGGATTAPAFQVGDPVPGTGNKANPEMILNPENAPIQVIRLSEVLKDFPRFFAGTSSGLGTAAAPQDFPTLRQDPTAPVARTTADEDIQQTPGLRFIQGGGDEDFNRLSTSTIEGPFGTGLPLAGALNFTRAQEALQDPITGPLLSSLFRAASLNFAGEVERARKRAPTGQSLASTLVRT